MNPLSPKQMRKEAQRLQAGVPTKSKISWGALQVTLARAQEALDRATVEASAGGGAVTVVMSASGRVQRVSIAPEAVDAGDVGLLEDLITVAFNEALVKAQKAQAESLGSLGLPGL